MNCNLSAYFKRLEIKAMKFVLKRMFLSKWTTVNNMKFEGKQLHRIRCNNQRNNKLLREFLKQ